ncbi:MAG TPA: RpoL/Rpb11 RNA polymerase subunit family protein [Methanomassiliicoccaceae archaeon]|nr:RpoL/Rpb11 RNA polymerase subunit family protein [Methanomassiliicoccaceae archaeon]HOQ25471.1 RpoL/Rpb11 RNA polymerase subunit family protein [Methanomassiliicoccaceae archaeon]HPP44191.1 RpoL/Rpb11 RNA polymerase subunit family protein [Methanomassiliicoccaceae archaeon]HPT74811.1 RpoL/Rpb11 RNA polymerase subunit family protein [Methanomassiliicoccaceae archaeon]
MDDNMELLLIDKDKDSITVQIRDADMTVIQPIINELLEDEGVAEVDYNSGHPELDLPVLYVKVKNGKPQTALKRAAKSLSNLFKEGREKLEKSM